MGADLGRGQAHPRSATKYGQVRTLQGPLIMSFLERGAPLSFHLQSLWGAGWAQPPPRITVRTMPGLGVGVGVKAPRVITAASKQLVISAHLFGASLQPQVSLQLLSSPGGGGG